MHPVPATDDFEFGVFDLADLFSRTLKRKSYRDLRTAEKRELGAIFDARRERSPSHPKTGIRALRG